MFSEHEIIIYTTLKHLLCVARISIVEGSKNLTIQKNNKHRISKNRIKQANHQWIISMVSCEAMIVC